MFWLNIYPSWAVKYKESVDGQEFGFVSNTATFQGSLGIEPRHEKTGFLHMRKQRRRSASR